MPICLVRAERKERGFSRRRLSEIASLLLLIGNNFHLFHVKLAQRLLIRSVDRIRLTPSLLLPFTLSLVLLIQTVTYSVRLELQTLLLFFLSFFSSGQAGAQAPRIYSLGFSVQFIRHSSII